MNLTRRTRELNWWLKEERKREDRLVVEFAGLREMRPEDARAVLLQHYDAARVGTVTDGGFRGGFLEYLAGRVAMERDE